MFDCRIAAAPHTALLPAIHRLRCFSPPSSPDGTAFPLPVRGRIGLAASRRAACAIIEGTDSARLVYQPSRRSQSASSNLSQWVAALLVAERDHWIHSTRSPGG